jgi:hypothetical protein
MAVYSAEANSTFFVYGNEENAPAIGKYDHSAKSFSRPIVLGSNPDMDAHRNPTLLIDEDGFIYVFYGAHGHPTHVLRSGSPLDIGAAWDARADIVDPGTSYPQPFQLLPGELFVSYRQQPGWRFRRSGDGGQTWADPIDIAAFDGCAIYGITIAETGDYPRKLHFVWSRLGGGTEEEIRGKHLWARRYNIYYACTEDGGKTWKQSDGTPYELPISEDNAEKIYDCGERGVWLKDIQLSQEGDPLVLFIDGDVSNFHSEWKFARLRDKAWSFSDVCTSDHMYDDGALAVLDDRDLRMYGPVRASQPVEDGGEIEVWQSVDGGTNWSHLESLTEHSKYSHNNVKIVYNHGSQSGDFRMMWSYGDSLWPASSEAVRIYCYGENRDGPIVIRSGE